jgi:hypothetical protein
MSHDPGADATFWIVFFSAFAITLGAALVFALAFYVVNALALMSLFGKVGVRPWIGWVPFYNTWTVLELGGQPGPLALLSIVPYGSYVVLVFRAIANYRTDLAFRKPTSWVVLAIFLPFVWAFLLGRAEERYQPELNTAAGYPPPKVGFGSRS